MRCSSHSAVLSEFVYFWIEFMHQPCMHSPQDRTNLYRSTESIKRRHASCASCFLERSAEIQHHCGATAQVFTSVRLILVSTIYSNILDDVRRLLFVQLLLVAFWLHIYLLEHSIYSNSISRDLWLCTFATLITLTHDLLLHTTPQHDCLYSDLIIRLRKFGVFVCEKYIPPSLPNSQCRLCTVFWILRLYFHHKRQYFRISLLVVANTDIMDQSW